MGLLTVGTSWVLRIRGLPTYRLVGLIIYRGVLLREPDFKAHITPIEVLITILISSHDPPSIVNKVPKRVNVLNFC